MDLILLFLNVKVFESEFPLKANAYYFKIPNHEIVTLVCIVRTDLGVHLPRHDYT